MLVKPPIEELLPQVENRYVLTMLCAKRARQLVNGARPMTAEEHDNNVTLAAYELAEGTLKYARGRHDDRLFVPLRPEIEAKRLEEAELARLKREEAMAEEGRRQLDPLSIVQGGQFAEGDEMNVFHNENSRVYAEQLIQLIQQNVQNEENEGEQSPEDVPEV